MVEGEGDSKTCSCSARRMGLDVGEKTVGIALSDELGITAQPYGTLHRRGHASDVGSLVRMVEEEGVSEVVVGMPLCMSGVAAGQARRVKAFAARLEAELRVPVVFWDERLSTVAAERVLLEANMSRARRKRVVDKVAAAIILQGYLDLRRSRR